jgi:hypothetical protein
MRSYVEHSSFYITAFDHRHQARFHPLTSQTLCCASLQRLSARRASTVKPPDNAGGGTNQRHGEVVSGLGDTNIRRNRWSGSKLRDPNKPAAALGCAARVNADSREYPERNSLPFSPQDVYFSRPFSLYRSCSEHCIACIARNLHGFVVI